MWQLIFFVSFMISTVAEAACDKYQGATTWSTTAQFQQSWPTNGQECGIQASGSNINIMSCQPNGATLNYCANGADQTCSKCMDAFSQAVGQPSFNQPSACQTNFQYQGTCYTLSTMEVTDNCTMPPFIDPTTPNTMKKAVCKAGYYCEVTNSALPCQALKNNGDNCVNSYECQSSFCSGGKCFAPFSSSEGTTCTKSHECASLCCTTTCVKSFSQPDGTQMKDADSKYCCAPGTYLDGNNRCVAYPTTAPACTCATTGWAASSFGNPMGSSGCAFGTCDCAAGKCTIPDKTAEQTAVDCLNGIFNDYVDYVRKTNYDMSVDRKTVSQMGVKLGNNYDCCSKKAGLDYSDWKNQTQFEPCTSPASSLQVSMGLVMVLMVAMAFFL